MCGSGRRFDYFIPKPTHNIENLVEDSDCLNTPFKRLVDYLEPLIVTNNIEEHCNLLLNRAPTCLFN